MNGIIRVVCAVNKVNVANPHDCAEECRTILEQARPGGFDIALFPKLALCSPSCGSFFSGSLLTEQCAVALGALQAACEGLDGYVVAGLAVDDEGKSVSAMAVIYRGELIGLIPTLDNPRPLVSGGYSPYILPVDTVLGCGEMRFCVLGCSLDLLAGSVAEVVKTGCDLILVPAYTPARAGREEEIRELAGHLARSYGVAIALVNGGVGDTSHPYVYRGFAGINECGEELAFLRPGYTGGFCAADLDLDIIRSQKLNKNYSTVFHGIKPAEHAPGLLRTVEKTPFLPAAGRDSYLADLFDLQARSLANRMENIGVSRAVVGVSGGLDSTAVLIACTRAMDELGLGRENIIAITMPGFGTGDRTYYNALKLMECLGVGRRDIPIREAVQQHLEDIGHTGRQDTVYENAQARERAQILLDVANAVGGIVVGSGDLSEAALGFSTFGGDHIASYNVNVCIPKTVLREMVKYIARRGLVSDIAEVVEDIVDTPVSPELLPPGQSGEISQRTEEILGPYFLHDFFLYYFLKYAMRPSKIFHYAATAFAGDMDPDFIRDKLKLFIKRFCAGQFKRSCSPDAASITRVNLGGAGFAMPSDLDPTLLINDLDSAGV